VRRRSAANRRAGQPEQRRRERHDTHRGGSPGSGGSTSVQADAGTAGATGGGGSAAAGGSAGAGGFAATGGSDAAGGSAGAAGAPPACVDVPPHEYTCEQEQAWGKCGADFMTGFCLKTCGNCVASDAGATPPGPGSDCGLLPVDPNASPEARALLCFLKTQQGKKMVSGQTDLDSLQWVAGDTGKTPAILGLEMQYYTSQMGNKTGNTAVAIDWWHNSGLVTFQWHWVSPSGASDLNKGFYTEKTSFDLAAALANKSSGDYAGLIKDIDTIATELKKLADANVPILFRPLHEAAGGWFWWGAKGAGPCKELYSIMFDRFVNQHGIHNLVWVWVAYPTNANHGNPNDWYPGNNRVDVVVSDYEQEQRDFDELSKLSNGTKPVGLAETMNPPEPSAAIAGGTPWAYFVTWARRDWNASSAGDMKKAMQSPLAITRDAMPDVAAW
jgi:mannan endo-1,4-beta-mannosidase